MPKTDIYASFAALSSDQLEGRDYVICIRRVRDSRIAILAPHGGKIEPLTAELAYSIAGNEHNFYAFKGIKPSGNRDLHITSTNFDEPEALNLIASCDHILTIHGLSGRDCSIQIGGRDCDLQKRINNNLTNAKFVSRVVNTGPWGGLDPCNICNRGRSQMGVQIEIKKGLRDSMKINYKLFSSFVNEVRNAIELP